MTTEQKGDDEVKATEYGGGILGQYRRLKAHAEAYPYVWGSYIVVYGGFGLYLAYRWRKLRQTEDRVRVLQKKLAELGPTREASVSSSTASTSSSTSKVSK